MTLTFDLDIEKLHKVKIFEAYQLRGPLSKKLDVFKELTPRLRTYELRGQGKE